MQNAAQVQAQLWGLLPLLEGCVGLTSGMSGCGALMVCSVCGSWFALCHVLAMQEQHEGLGCKLVAPEPRAFVGLKLRAALPHQKLLLCSDFKAKFSSHFLHPFVPGCRRALRTPCHSHRVGFGFAAQCNG